MATLAETLQVESKELKKSSSTKLLMKGTTASGIRSYHPNLKVIFPNEFSKK